MADMPPHAVRCLKDDGDRGGVWLVERPDQSRRTIKLWRLTPGGLLKLVLGIAQAQRQIHGAKRLERAGVATPPVVEGCKILRFGGKRYIKIEMDYIEGRSAYEVLQSSGGDEGDLSRFARLIGLAVAKIAQAGLFHRDLKLRNVILDEASDPPAVWVIDPVGVRRLNDLPVRFLRMIDRLAVEAIEEDIPLPAKVWRPVIRAALSGQDRILRRVVCHMLRRHLRQ